MHFFRVKFVFSFNFYSDYSYKFKEEYINIQIKTYDKNNNLHEYSTTYKIDKKIPFKFYKDTKENIKKVVVSITLTTAQTVDKLNVNSLFF